MAGCHLAWFPAQRFSDGREESEILGHGTRLVVISQTRVSQRVQMNRHDPLISGMITTQNDVTGIPSIGVLSKAAILIVYNGHHRLPG